MNRPLTVTAIFFAAALAWCTLLAVDPASAASERLIAADGLVLASIAVVGILVAQARWARRLSIAVMVTLPILSIGVNVGFWWWAALGLGGVGLLGVLGPGLRPIVRQLPSASGPPVKSVLLIISLLAAPTVIAVMRPVHGAGWIAAAVCVGVGAWYAKAAPAALAVVRIAPPVAILAAGVIGHEAWQLILAAPFAAFVAYLAWTADARLAVHPLIASERPVPLPPQLVPPEILDAAGLDARGRPKDNP